MLPRVSNFSLLLVSSGFDRNKGSCRGTPKGCDHEGGRVSLHFVNSTALLFLLDFGCVLASKRESKVFNLLVTSSYSLQHERRVIYYFSIDIWFLTHVRVLAKTIETQSVNNTFVQR